MAKERSRSKDSSDKLKAQCARGPIINDPNGLLPVAAAGEFLEGHNFRVQQFLGAHPHRSGDQSGYRFAVWAPNADQVLVQGDFNDWQGERHSLAAAGFGVFSGFVANAKPGQYYKYRIRNRETGGQTLKSDPYAQSFELRPGNASRLSLPSSYEWRDAAWLQARQKSDWASQPIAVYELHPGSWRRSSTGAFLNWRELAVPLCRYVSELGFSHIELTPVMEFPLDESWGYQTTGYFAPTARHGSADDFKFFVDECHRHALGVIMDWTPAHFPRDDFAMSRFDGGTLYEHFDPLLADHPDWGTLTFDFGKNEVRQFLISSALHWVEEFHVDGLRVDAVASMLYRDYSRSQWTPNEHGGRENIEAVNLLRDLNAQMQTQHAGVLVIAEESTSWPGVTHAIDQGGLGFAMKWKMGWMNDTLDWFRTPAAERRHHHVKLNFGLAYANAERFMVPLSHDEVVHGKAPLIYKMPGTEAERFAQLRLLLAWQWFYPAKKLLFMGSEFADTREWNSATELSWALLDLPGHQGVFRLVTELNRLYRAHPELHAQELVADGFEWLDCDDAHGACFSFMRRDETGRCLVVAFNGEAQHREGYPLRLPRAGVWREILNTDSGHYGGDNAGNGGMIVARREGDDRAVAHILVPKFSLLLFQHDS